MKNFWKYILVGALLSLVTFRIALPFFGGMTYASGIGSGAYPMGMHMVGRGFGLFAGFGMLGMWLLPLLTLGLIVAGITWVIRSAKNDTQA
ncbi:MAG: hypothetical protein L3J16_01980 [Anaerolineales bacterium]|nr:hypothetical protein [Anaerolineales bacterium]